VSQLEGLPGSGFASASIRPPYHHAETMLTIHICHIFKLISPVHLSHDESVVEVEVGNCFVIKGSVRAVVINEYPYVSTPYTYMKARHRPSHGGTLISLLILLCALLIANIAIMVRKPATAPIMELAKKESPEDSSMKKGLFQEDNTVPPKEERVLPLFSLKNKTAIVSGSGAGIGLAVVKAFAEAGANVAIWYHSNKNALDRAAEIEETYGVKCMTTIPVLCIQCDGSLTDLRQGLPSRCHRLRAHEEDDQRHHA
jgi:hypothetical protein